MLASGATLAAHYRDHPLQGPWRGGRDCHTAFRFECTNGFRVGQRACARQTALASELAYSGETKPESRGDCHLRSDVVLLYEQGEQSIRLVRVGSHSELFGR